MIHIKGFSITNILLIAIVLVFGLPSLGFGQVLPVCNEKSGLAWDMNTEADMDKYTLYYGPESGIAMGGAGVQTEDIPHDPSTAVDNGDGTFSMVHKLTLGEGDTFMAITASDKSGNETGLSNEVGCKINMTPATPSVILRFNLPVPVAP